MAGNMPTGSNVGEIIGGVLGAILIIILLLLLVVAIVLKQKRKHAGGKSEHVVYASRNGLPFPC